MDKNLIRILNDMTFSVQPDGSYTRFSILVEQIDDRYLIKQIEDDGLHTTLCDDRNFGMFLCRLEYYCGIEKCDWCKKYTIEDYLKENVLGEYKLCLDCIPKIKNDEKRPVIECSQCGCDLDDGEVENDRTICEPCMESNERAEYSRE